MATKRTKTPATKPRKNTALSKPTPIIPSPPKPANPSSGLLPELRDMILSARQQVAREVNSALVMLYWQIGARIHKDILQEQRAEYGLEIVPTVSAQLAPEFGEGFSKRNLFRMVQFAEAFPTQEIVATASAQLGWSHIIELLPLKKPLQREFYTEMCRLEGWSVRTLRDKISGALYERTALSKKPEGLIEKELKALREERKLTPDLVFKDPYFLDFLGLKNNYSEKDLEAAILREMEAFLLEMGDGFAFVARQKRIVVDGADFYMDLLFYWHLATRPDELQAMREPALKEAAVAIDERLSAASFQTLVHGDAKVANFCFTEDAQTVAAVDFQYVGGGVGVKDLAYFLGSVLEGDALRALGDSLRDRYFEQLKDALQRYSPQIDATALEEEWRSLYPWAWADFERFLAGWSPGARDQYTQEQLDKVLHQQGS